MEKRPPSSSLAAGFQEALRHRRLALTLWLSLVATAALIQPQLRVLAGFFDDSAFRESILKGWDSWAVLSWLTVKEREFGILFPQLGYVILFSILLQLFLTGGLLRVLIAGVNRPIVRRLVGESAAIFRPCLWAFVRFLVSLVFWEAALVGGVTMLLGKLAGEDAPPNNPFAMAASWWQLVVGIVVFLVVGVRYDFARIAIARGDAPTARGAYRVAGLRLEGNRLPAILLIVFWLGLGLVVQAAFTHVGIRMNPQTDAGVMALVVVRQIGFILVAMVRVGYWGSLLRFEERHRPITRAPLPRPAFLPVIAETPIPLAPKDLEPEPELLGTA